MKNSDADAQGVQAQTDEKTPQRHLHGVAPRLPAERAQDRLIGFDEKKVDERNDPISEKSEVVPPESPEAPRSPRLRTA